jgi:hypothetical protein
MTYKDKKGKKHRACHTSKKNAQAQISAIERDKTVGESDDLLFDGEDLEMEEEGAIDVSEVTLRGWVKEFLGHFLYDRQDDCCWRF